LAYSCDLTTLRSAPIRSQVASRSSKKCEMPAMKPGPRIYNLFPPLIGSIDNWVSHLDRIAGMGFDWLFVNPFHLPGASGSIYAVKDYFRLNPLFRGDNSKSDDALLADFNAAAARRGIAVMMDLVINHTANDSILAEVHPEWFVRNPNGSLRAPRAVDPDDPEKVTIWEDLAEIDYRERLPRKAITEYWRSMLRHYIGLGFRGFRGDAAYQVPASVWRDLIMAARGERADAIFAAETLGCRVEQVTSLREAGFDYLFNSAKWWDFTASWLLEQYETYRHIAPSIAFPESHDTARLVQELLVAGGEGSTEIESIYRQRYLFCATFSTGVMMPVGYEFGFDRKLDVVRTRASDWQQARFDLSKFIADVNEMKTSLPVLSVEGPQSWMRMEDSGVVILVRTASERKWVATSINPDRRAPHDIEATCLRDLGVSLPGREVTPAGGAMRLTEDASIHLLPSQVRVFCNEV
jgi:starch synthase (maltosyl-transferring)